MLQSDVYSAVKLTGTFSFTYVMEHPCWPLSQSNGKGQEGSFLFRMELNGKDEGWSEQFSTQLTVPGVSRRTAGMQSGV